MKWPRCPRGLWWIAACFVFVFSGCESTPRKPPVTAFSRPSPNTRPNRPALDSVFQPIKLAEIDRAINEAIATHHCPGAVLWLERNGVSYHRAYGHRALVPAKETMTQDTIFDVASLTKVLATTPAIMWLIEHGKVKLDAPVKTYLPEFTGDGRDAITVRELLTHTSGLRPDISLKPDWHGYQAAIRLCCQEKPVVKPGTKFIYSDTNFILLAEIVRRVSGESLDQFVAAKFYRPLHMVDTGFNPPRSERPRIAPTEVQPNGLPFRGVVDDPRARRMGGVAGHAGLFTTAADMARFARMMLNGGELDGVRVLQPQTVRLMTTVQTAPAVRARRGLGWDIDSPYSGERGSIFPLGGYGHTGWTGGSIWIDPFSRTFVILLTNRNHPTDAGNVLALRHKVATLAAQAVIGFNFSFVPGALPAERARVPAKKPRATAVKSQPVLSGIDVLEKEHFAPLRGLRIGLITNQTGQDRHRRSTIDLLRQAPNVRLVALFSPEHGIRGVLDTQVANSVDAKTGLPVYSLYGRTRQPTAAELRGLDALVFDIQDVGCRYYTFISTMGLSMEAAARAGLKFFVLDRPDPIGGTVVAGPVYEGPSTFTAFHRLPVRYGMTAGELARLFNAERGWHCKLTVIRMQGWTRHDWFDETGQPWSNPSPNMRSVTEAMLYPGVGLLEPTDLSVGRGTGTPFEVVGAPYIDDVKWATLLNRAGLPGVRFIPVRFTPTASRYAHQLCGGVRVLLTDRETCPVVDLGIVMAQTLYRLYPHQFQLARFNGLLQDPAVIQAIRAGQSLAQIKRSWAPALAAFRHRREKYLLYR